MASTIKPCRQSSILRAFLIFGAIILAILTSGCVGTKVKTYGGDELQKTETAVIKGSYYFSPAWYHSIEIWDVDGKRPQATQVEVLPGWHELIILETVFSFFAVFPGGPSFCVQASCDFEAGHEYRIKTTTFIDKNDLMEIVDVNTGVTICSNKWIYCRELSEEPIGCIGIKVSGELAVTRVVSGSQAEKAGVKVGDKWKSVNGIQVKSEREYFATVPSQKVGEKRTFVFERDGKEFAVDLVGEPRSNFFGK